MSLIPEKYSLYLQLFKTIVKYWNSELLSESPDVPDADVAEWKPDPNELVADLKNMGPAFIKLGQLLSTRPDLLPEPYLLALAQLQDDVGTSCTLQQINEIIEEDFGLGAASLFAYFNPEPLATASIGQVHEATLPDGQKVIVKIRKPGIKKQLTDDVKVLENLSEKAENYSSRFKRMAVHQFISEFKCLLFAELDYEKERQNLIVLKENLGEFKYLTVPVVFEDYCSQRVLTMEFIEGKKITELTESEKNAPHVKDIVEDFIKGYLKQIITDGFVHLDPHPGNILLTPTKKLAVLDLGMVTRYGDEMKNYILKLIIALSENDGDQMSKILLEKCEYDRESTNLNRFKQKVVRKVAENENSTAGDLKTGRSILEVQKIAAQEGIILPIELISLGKVMLNLDQIIATLAPEAHLQEIIRKYVGSLIRKQSVSDLTSGNLVQTLLESKELVTQLPYRLNKISDKLANDKLRIKIDTIDEKEFIKAFQKVANRITVGLIIAALILGAALIMRIPTQWTMWGYPGFAVLLFLLAAIIGFYLVYQILLKDK